MAARLVPVLKFVTKGGLAGGAVYVAYDQGLLGSSTQGAEAFRKAQAALPPAIQEWISYTGWELPPIPKLEFSPSDFWNKGKITSHPTVKGARAKRDVELIPGLFQYCPKWNDGEGGDRCYSLVEGALGLRRLQVLPLTH
uniref:MICOS complex subunit MIC13 n=1 Tax=Strigops habroptila TaxID=2489341 RepID=A0A672TX61_STRHB